MRNILKQTNRYLALPLLAGVMLTSCTDLEVEPTDSLLAEGFTDAFLQVMRFASGYSVVLAYRLGEFVNARRERS